jgi:hypothetical protein
MMKALGLIIVLFASQLAVAHTLTQFKNKLNRTRPCEALLSYGDQLVQARSAVDSFENFQSFDSGKLFRFLAVALRASPDRAPLDVLTLAHRLKLRGYPDAADEVVAFAKKHWGPRMLPRTRALFDFELGLLIKDEHPSQALDLFEQLILNKEIVDKDFLYRDVFTEILLLFGNLEARSEKTGSQPDLAHLKNLVMRIKSQKRFKEIEGGYDSQSALLFSAADRAISVSKRKPKIADAAEDILEIALEALPPLYRFQLMVRQLSQHEDYEKFKERLRDTAQKIPDSQKMSQWQNLVWRLLLLDWPHAANDYLNRAELIDAYAWFAKPYVEFIRYLTGNTPKEWHDTVRSFFQKNEKAMRVWLKESDDSAAANVEDAVVYMTYFYLLVHSIEREPDQEGINILRKVSSLALKISNRVSDFSSAGYVLYFNYPIQYPSITGDKKLQEQFRYFIQEADRILKAHKV